MEMELKCGDKFLYTYECIYICPHTLLKIKCSPITKYLATLPPAPLMTGHMYVIWSFCHNNPLTLFISVYLI